MKGNERVVRRFWEEVWNEKRFDAIDELVAEGFTLHSAGTRIGPRSEFKPWVEGFHDDVGGIEFVVHDLFSGDGKVTTRWTIRGTHEGIFDLPATGEPIEFTGLTVFAVADGRLRKGWVERSAYELYTRLAEGSARDPV